MTDFLALVGVFAILFWSVKVWMNFFMKTNCRALNRDNTECRNPVRGRKAKCHYHGGRP